MTWKQFPLGWREILARALLLLSLLQIAMFFVGLEVPLQRLIRLWGKSFKERQAIVWPAGRTLSEVAEQLPLNAKVYLEDPQTLPWWVSAQAQYYFCPRYLTITMTDHYHYTSDKEFSKWNEYPKESWLVDHGFTYLMSFKNRMIRIQPIVSLAPIRNATTR